MNCLFVYLLYFSPFIDADKIFMEVRECKCMKKYPTILRQTFRNRPENDTFLLLQLKQRLEHMQTR